MDGQDVVLLVSVHDWNRVEADVLMGLVRISVRAGAQLQRQTWILTDEKGAAIKSKAGKTSTVELSITYRGPPSPSPPAVSRDLGANSELERELAAAIAEVANLKSQLAAEQERRVALEEELSANQEQLAAAAVSQRASDATVVELQGQLAEGQQANEANASALEEQVKQLSEHFSCWFVALGGRLQSAHQFGTHLHWQVKQLSGQLQKQKSPTKRKRVILRAKEPYLVGEAAERAVAAAGRAASQEQKSPTKSKGVLLRAKEPYLAGEAAAAAGRAASQAPPRIPAHSIGEC